MRVTTKKFQEHRRALLESAATLFARLGLEGASITEITAAVQLTHGGFYKHFASKDAMFSEAVQFLLQQLSSELSYKRAGDGPGAVVASRTISDELSGLDGRCPIAGVAADVARSDAKTQQTFAKGLRACLGDADQHNPGSPAWQTAAADLSMAVGAYMMAKAVKGADPELARSILRAARAQALG